MAVTPQSNEAFLREVDEELRRDQLTSVWQRHGRWLVVAIVAALALFAAYLFWQHRREQARGAEGEQLQSAFDALGQKDFGKAGPTLATLAGSGSEGYRALAIFTQGDILLQKNDLKGAAAKFASIAADGSQPQPFRDLALVRQTMAEYDTLKPNVVVERLRPLAVKGNPWLGSAGELVAAAYLRQGRRDLAGRMFGTIASDEGVPATIRQRAVQMASVMGADAAPANEDVKAR